MADNLTGGQGSHTRGSSLDDMLGLQCRRSVAYAVALLVCVDVRESGESRHRRRRRCRAVATSMKEQPVSLNTQRYRGCCTQSKKRSMVPLQRQYFHPDVASSLIAGTYFQGGVCVVGDIPRTTKFCK